MVFVFIQKSDSMPTDTLDMYSVGLLDSSNNLSELMVTEKTAVGFRDLINSIPSEVPCYFVGLGIRSILAEIQRSLILERLDMPEKLKIHWVAPYKIPLDDIGWLYNYGMFTEVTFQEIDLKLGVTKESDSPILKLAKIYFALIGDFNKLN
jgi:hypothetical protein